MWQIQLNGYDSERHMSNGSFPLSGTVWYSSVHYDSVWVTLIQLAFSLPIVPLLGRRGVYQNVAINDKVRQLAQLCLFLLNVGFNEQ